MMLTLVLLYSGFMFSQVETSTLSIISVCHRMRTDVAAALLSRGRPCHSSASIRVRVDRSRNYMELLRRQLPHDGPRKFEAGDAVEGESAVEHG